MSHYMNLSHIEDKISIWTIQHVGLDSSDTVYRYDVSHERLSSLRKSEPCFFPTENDGNTHTLQVSHFNDF